MENRIKELHHGLEIDRTSCTKFWANQFRVLMTAAAYVLMQELRLRAARTACARAQVWTLRERLLKLGAHVVVSVRRVVVHLPVSFPFLASFRQIALSFGTLLSVSFVAAMNPSDFPDSRACQYAGWTYSPYLTYCKALSIT